MFAANTGGISRVTVTPRIFAVASAHISPRRMLVLDSIRSWAPGRSGICSSALDSPSELSPKPSSGSLPHGKLLFFYAAFLPPDLLRAGFQRVCSLHAEAPNIIFITVDTTRADRMGFLGSKRGLTPNLDVLAWQGVVFERAYSQAPLTPVSHATIFTGTYPAVSHCHRFRPSTARPPALRS